MADGPPSPEMREDPIPPEVEEEVLQILEETDPGPAREAALAALGLSSAVRLAVDDWLREVEAEQDSDFLQSPQEPSGVTAGMEDSLPRRFGAYELQEILGRGGMGIVYRAEDLRLGRQVALKALPPHFADNPKRLQRFEREVRAVAALRHDHIIPVFQADKIGDTPFFTMEWIQGRSLDQVLRALQQRQADAGQLTGQDWLAALELDTPPAPPRTYLGAISQLCIQIAEALDHAHGLGIVHRDVKPSNIMLRPDQRALLFDFGLARLDDEIGVTRTSEVIGSPHYMSPEQVRGNSEELDARTDVYSLGVTLYELLTLQPPFRVGNPEQIYQMILHREPRRPSLINREVPRDLETICLTAIEKDPARRYQTAADLAADLRRFQRLEPVQARPIGRLLRSWRWTRRNRLLVTISALLLVSVWAFWIAQSSAQETHSERRLRTAAERQQEQTSLRLDDARRELGQLQRERASIQQDLSRLRIQQAEARDALKERAAELETLKRQQAEQTRKLAANEAETRRLRQAAEKQKGLLETEQARLVQTQKQSRALREAIREQQQALQAAEANLKTARRRYGDLATNHRRTRINRLLSEGLGLRGRDPGLGLILCHAAAGLLEAADPPGLQAQISSALLEMLQSSQETLTFSGHSATVTGLAFSPGGGELLSCAEDGSILLWDREDGQVLASTSRPDQGWIHLEFLAAGNQALLASESGELFRWDLRSGSAPVRLALARHQSGSPRHVGRNGRFLVSHVEHLPGRLQCWPLERGRPSSQAFVLGAEGITYTSFHFGPVGNMIAATSTLNRVDVFDLEARRSLLQLPLRSEILDQRFDSEGRRLALLCADGRILVVGSQDATPKWRARLELQAPLTEGSLSFCDDDRRLLVHSGGGMTARLFDLADPADPGRPLIGAATTGHHFELDTRTQQVLALPQDNGEIEVYRLPDHRPALTLRGHLRRPRETRRLLSFSPDGRSLASASGGSRVRLWRTRPGGALRRFAAPGPRPARILDAGFTPSAQHLLAVAEDGMHFWFRFSGQHQRFGGTPPLRPRPAQLGAATGLLAGLGGRDILVIDGRSPRLQPRLQRLPLDPELELEQLLAWPGPGIATVLRERAGQRRLEIRDLAGGLRLQRVLPSGRPGGGRVHPHATGTHALLGHQTLHILELEGSAAPRALAGAQRPFVQSRDGSTLLASTGFGLAIYGLPHGAQMASLPAAENPDAHPVALQIAPDRRLLATAWSDGHLRLYSWDGTRATRHASPTVPPRAYSALAFSPDGTRLAAVGIDGSLQLFACADASLRFELRGDSPCHAVRFSPDGRELLLAHSTYLRLIPSDLRAFAAQVLPRPLSAAERLRYGLED